MREFGPVFWSLLYLAEFFCVSVTLLLQEQASLKISIAYNNINLGLVELRQAQQLIEGAPDVMKDQQLWWGTGRSL